ncbi:hypothetical protein C8R42DRAFT_772519 [Lentinula raphanica]|nr:hypothetical protein C8R42DRAFT_772519 [Lentinula raphanica]
MADSLDCFSLCFCCFCFSICGQSETSSCRWLCPCCHSHRNKFDDDPAMNDAVLDAIVERQLYEQRAAYDAAHTQSKGLQHPYAPQIPPAAAKTMPSEKGSMVTQEPQGMMMKMPTPSHTDITMPEPMHARQPSANSVGQELGPERK